MVEKFAKMWKAETGQQETTHWHTNKNQLEGCLAHKIENIYYLDLYRKIMLTPKLVSRVEWKIE